MWYSLAIWVGKKSKGDKFEEQIVDKARRFVAAGGIRALEQALDPVALKPLWRSSSCKCRNLVSVRASLIGP